MKHVHALLGGLYFKPHLFFSSFFLFFSSCAAGFFFVGYEHDGWTARDVSSGCCHNLWVCVWDEVFLLGYCLTVFAFVPFTHTAIHRWRRGGGRAIATQPLQRAHRERSG